jgi:DNA repair exonuclease SbcCD ATPase subunit
MFESKRCHLIKSLSVTGGFLDSLDIQFVDGLNCLIGHRGTGKTTILEFVRYVLNEFQPGDVGQVCRRRVESLVRQNLGDGRIRLTIQTKDGLDYIVDRTATGNPIVLTIDGQPTDITINSGGIFSADLFSQNEVENIADSPESQLALIDAFVADEIASLDTAIAEVHAKLQANAKTMVPAQITLAKLADELTTLKSVEDRIDKLAHVGGENADQMNQAQTHKALRDRETHAIGQAKQQINEYTEWLCDANGRFTTGVDSLFAEDVINGPNGSIIQAIRTQMHQTGNELDKLFQQAVALLHRSQSELAVQTQELQGKHSQQELAFRDLMTRHKEAQGQATERAQWERKRNDLLNKQRQHKELKDRLQTLQSERQTHIDQLTELRDQRFNLRLSIAQQITDAVSSPVRVRIAQDENREQYICLLADVLKHAGINHNQVAKRIAKVVAPSELVSLVQQLDIHSLQKQTTLNGNQAEKVINALNDTELLLKIEIVDLIDLPKIELKDGDHWKDSLSLSTGQKCTTILPILLLDSENPLLIDQPEDNLDNRFIYDTVVEGIHRVKANRQLILITHNPNIPVLGDAAHVFVLTSDGNQSRLLNQGDVDTCKPEIINLLEGGEEAFAQRRERYAR